MKTTYNILDFETTGLSADYDRVIEVGVVKIQNNQIIDTFQEFVNPSMKISSVITNLTGITNEMVKNAEKSYVVFPKLQSFVKKEIIVAHNASFDSRFFKAEMNRNNIYPENNFLCSLLLARRIFQELPSHKLSSLCGYLGFVNKASHRAFEDAEVTYKVFDAICERVKNHSNREILDYDFLANLSKIPKKKVNTWLKG